MFTLLSILFYVVTEEILINLRSLKMTVLEYLDQKLGLCILTTQLYQVIVLRKSTWISTSHINFTMAVCPFLCCLPVFVCTHSWLHCAMLSPWNCTLIVETHISVISPLNMLTFRWTGTWNNGCLGVLVDRVWLSKSCLLLVNMVWSDCEVIWSR